MWILPFGNNRGAIVFCRGRDAKSIRMKRRIAESIGLRFYCFRKFYDLQSVRWVFDWRSILLERVSLQLTTPLWSRAGIPDSSTL